MDLLPTARVVYISKEHGISHTALDTYRSEPIHHSMRIAQVAFFSLAGNRIRVNRIVGAFVPAHMTANTVTIINNYNAILILIESIFITGIYAGSIAAVVA